MQELEQGEQNHTCFDGPARSGQYAGAEGEKPCDALAFEYFPGKIDWFRRKDAVRSQSREHRPKAGCQRRRRIVLKTLVSPACGYIMVLVSRWLRGSRRDRLHDRRDSEVRSPANLSHQRFIRRVPYTGEVRVHLRSVGLVEVRQEGNKQYCFEGKLSCIGSGDSLVSVL